jgi:bla regulator protein BlaR1
MLYLILKSVACLAVFMLFYKLVLEQLSIHHFKRYYLILAIIASILIPFITFYNYIDVAIPASHIMPTTVNTTEQFIISETTVESTNHLPYILWSIYGLGVLFFSIKFILNISVLAKQIKKNEHIINKPFVTVLLDYKTIPHTFFNYIFFYKIDYKSQQIPEAVILHEQTHSKEKHSLDICFIELLQIVFWINPLLYLIKKDIRLNHEFLADASVLKKGVSTKTYQYTLLDYTMRLPKNSLANAINYPTLKKRFKIMKTQSSKTSVLMRTIFIAPILALLVFSFSKTETIENYTEVSLNEQIPVLYISQNPFALMLNNKQTTLKELYVDYTNTNNNSLEELTIQLTDMDFIPLSLVSKIKEAIGEKIVKINLENGYIKHDLDENYFTNKENKFQSNLVNLPSINNQGIGCNNCLVGMTKDDLKKISFQTTLNEEVMSFNVTFPNQSSIAVVGNVFNEEVINRLNTYNSTKYIVISEIKTKDEILKSKVSVKLKNDGISKAENLLTVNGIICEGKCALNFTKKQLSSLILGTTRGEEITQFKIQVPTFPTVAIKGHQMNTEALEFINKATIGQVIVLYQINSKDSKFSPVTITLVDESSAKISKSPKVLKAELINIPPPPPAPPVILKGEKSNIPPPPPPAKTVEQKISGFENFLNDDDFKNSKIYYEGKVITKEEAIALFKKDGKIDMITGKDNQGNYKIELTKIRKVLKGEASNVPPPPKK